MRAELTAGQAAELRKLHALAQRAQRDVDVAVAMLALGVAESLEGREVIYELDGAKPFVDVADAPTPAPPAA